MIFLAAMIDNEKEQSKFDRIYNTYKNMVYAVAYDVLKNVHDAEDTVQISFIKVIRLLPRIDENDIDTLKFRKLMIIIARNTAIDLLRKAKILPIPCEEIEAETLQDAEELYFKTEDYKNLVRCLNELNEGYQDILRLKLLYRLSAKEIAQILNITEVNVNVRYIRAKRRLAAMLEEYEKYER